MKKTRLRNEVKPININENTWYYLEGNKVTLVKQLKKDVIAIPISFKKHISKWFRTVGR